MPTDAEATAALRTRLRQAAVALLARREYTRRELERKLHDRLRRWSTDGEPTPAASALVGDVLDELDRRGLQSDHRAVEVVLAARSAAWGERRLLADLRRRGVDARLAAESIRPLRADELGRAAALWQRRFGTLAEAPAERARQLRWLAARGFSAETARRVVGGAIGGGDAAVDDDDSGEPGPD